MGVLYSYFLPLQRKAQSSGLSPSPTDDGGQKDLAATTEGYDGDTKQSLSAAEEKPAEEPESNDTSYGVEATAVRTLAASTGTVAILGTTAKVKESNESNEAEEENVSRDERNYPNISITEAEVIKSDESPEESVHRQEEPQLQSSDQPSEIQTSELIEVEIVQHAQSEEEQTKPFEAEPEPKSIDTEEQKPESSPQTLIDQNAPLEEKPQELETIEQDMRDISPVPLSGTEEKNEVLSNLPIPTAQPEPLIKEEPQKPKKEPVRIVDYQEKKDISQRRYEEKAKEQNMPYLDEKRLIDLNKPPDPGDPGDPGDPNISSLITGFSLHGGNEQGERKRSTDSEIGSPDDSKTEEDNEISSEQLKTNSLSDMSLSEALNSEGEEAAREAAKAQELQEMVASLSAAANQEVLDYELALNDMTPACQGPSQLDNIVNTSTQELDTVKQSSTPIVHNVISEEYVTEKFAENKESYAEKKIEKDKSFDSMKTVYMEETHDQKDEINCDAPKKEDVEIKELHKGLEEIIETKTAEMKISQLASEKEALSKKELEKLKEPEKESEMTKTPEEEIPLALESQKELTSETKSEEKLEEETKSAHEIKTSTEPIDQVNANDTQNDADKVTEVLDKEQERQQESLKKSEDVRDSQQEPLIDEGKLPQEIKEPQKEDERKTIFDNEKDVKEELRSESETATESEKTIHAELESHISNETEAISQENTNLDKIVKTEEETSTSRREQENAPELINVLQNEPEAPKDDTSQKELLQSEESPSIREHAENEDESKMKSPSLHSKETADKLVPDSTRHIEYTTTNEILIEPNVLDGPQESRTTEVSKDIKDEPSKVSSKSDEVPQVQNNNDQSDEIGSSLNAAATTIQSTFRGFKARKELKEAEKTSSEIEPEIENKETTTPSETSIQPGSEKGEPQKSMENDKETTDTTEKYVKSDIALPVNIPEPVMRIAQDEVNRICEEAEKTTESLMTPPPLIDYSEIRETDQDDSEDFPAPPDDLMEITEKNDITKDHDSSDTLSTDPTAPIGSNTDGESSKTEDTTAPSIAESEIKSAEPTTSQQNDDLKLESSITDNLNTEVAVHRDSTEGELTMEEDSKEEDLGSVIQSSKEQESEEKEKSEKNVESADSETKDKAAVIIQAGYQGFKTRKALKKDSAGAPQSPSVQSPSPQDTSSDKNYITDEDLPTREDSELDSKDTTSSTSRSEHEIIESAKKIQAGIRGYLVRKDQKIKRDAAIKIQSHFRGFKTRQRLKEEST